jgi:hypothetical protein
VYGRRPEEAVGLPFPQDSPRSGSISNNKVTIAVLLMTNSCKGLLMIDY